MNNLPTKLSGIVSKYAGNGRKLGYPTANINAETDLADGVYFGWADLADYLHQPALIFIGTPTTVGDTERRVEAHLLDVADRDYYGLTLNLKLIYFHRPNQKFASIKQLVLAMKADENSARAWFEHH